MNAPEMTETWFQGERMVLENRGVVEYASTKPDGTPYVLRYSVGVLHPWPKDAA